MKYDVVIIGSGLGGLECAYILSRSGKRVLLLEKGLQAGGCLQSYTRCGLSYDTGFHYVGGLSEGQSLYSVFKYLGLLNLPWRQMDSRFDCVKIGERSFDFVQGYDNFVEALAEDFPSERRALEKYVTMLKYSALHQYDALNPNFNDVSTFPDLFDVGAWDYLNETFTDSLLINVISGNSLKLELRKESLPLFTFAHANSGFIESSWRLMCDSSIIAESLLNSVRSYGGEIVYCAEVTELIEKDGKIAYAKCSNGEVYEGNIFVSDVHPSVTCGWLKSVGTMKNVYRNRVLSLDNTFGMFTVSLRIKPNTIKYFNKNYYVYKQPNVWTFYLEKDSVSGIMISCRVPEDGSEYVNRIDILTPMTWDKCELWENTSLGKRGKTYRQMKDRVASECIALAERSVPGISKCIEECYTSSPLTYRDYTSAPEGTAYGLRKDFQNPLLTMLSPRTPIPNLLLTGQSLMLHGLHGVTMTSLFTCANILGRDFIWNILEDK